MNAIYYILAVYQFISWIWITISLKNAPTDIELFGQELE
jgi:hypothetical protein